MMPPNLAKQVLFNHGQSKLPFHLHSPFRGSDNVVLPGSDITVKPYLTLILRALADSTLGKVTTRIPSFNSASTSSIFTCLLNL